MKLTQEQKEERAASRNAQFIAKCVAYHLQTRQQALFLIKYNKVSVIRGYKKIIEDIDHAYSEVQRYFRNGVDVKTACESETMISDAVHYFLKRNTSDMDTDTVLLHMAHLTRQFDILKHHSIEYVERF